MDKENLLKLLEQVHSGKVSPKKALDKISHLPYEDLSVALVDHHRLIRRGITEAIYGENKTKQEILTITQSFRKKKLPVIVTRIDEKKAKYIQNKYSKAKYNKKAKVLTIHQLPKKNKVKVGVIAAGTSDIAVSEEATLTLEFHGISVYKAYDVGVAGVHRLLDKIQDIKKCQVVIVVAGMEGALPSVVAGLIDKPVIAVPTSVGYGTGFKGISALLAMLNSCAGGIGVVNIDNGFGAASLAILIVNSQIQNQE